MVEDINKILSNRKEIIDLQGRFIVYFLLKEDKIVYVGSSENFLQRLSLHITKKEKDFDSYSFIELPNRAEMLKTEAENIIYYNPYYNKVLTESFISLARCKQKLIKEGKRIDLRKIKKYIEELKIKTYNYNSITYILDDDFRRISWVY